MVDLSYCAISSAIMPSLLKLNNLKSLKVFQNDWFTDDALLQILQVAPSIEYLDIGKTRVTDACVDMICQYGRHLKELTLYGNIALTRKMIEGLTSLPHLKVLKISCATGSKLSPSDTEACLCLVKKLHTLHLRRCDGNVIDTFLSHRLIDDPHSGDNIRFLDIRWSGGHADKIKECINALEGLVTSWV